MKNKCLDSSVAYNVLDNFLMLNEGAHAHICQGKCVYLHWKVLTHTFTKANVFTYTEPKVGTAMSCISEACF